MRKLLTIASAASLFALFAVATASAQQYMMLPPNSLVGNMNKFMPNPGNAVTLTDLVAALQGAGMAAAPTSATPGHVAAFGPTPGQFVDAGPAVGTMLSVTCGTGLIGGTSTSSVTCAVPNQVLLNTLTAGNSVTLGDTTSLTFMYSAYEIVFENILPVFNNDTLVYQVHSGGTFQSANYLGTTTFTGAAANIANTTTSIQLSSTSGVQNVGAGWSGTLRIIAPTGTASGKSNYGNGGSSNGTNFQTSVFGGIWAGSNGAIDGFQVKFAGGNITSGVIKIYGIQ